MPQQLISAPYPGTRRPARSVLIAKRSIDIAIGFCGTFFFGVLFPFMALFIKADSRGPVLYVQQRVGINRRIGTAKARSGSVDVGGRPFNIVKFRSMYLDSEKDGPRLAKLHGDTRVTRVGRWLRKLHIDEIPQFWNILKGDMSFIGPRPERPDFTLVYRESIPPYADRTLQTKPGLTGPAQICLGYDDSLETVVRKAYYDLAYTAALSSFRGWLRIEFWVFCQTFPYLFGRAAGAADAAKPLHFNEVAKMQFLNITPGGGSGHFTLSLCAKYGGTHQVLPNISPRDLEQRLAALNGQGGHKLEVGFSPDPKGFDLEDFRFLVGLIHRVRRSRGALTVYNTGRRLEESLREVHLNKVVQFRPVRSRIRNYLTVDVECWFHAHNLKSLISKGEWDNLEFRVVENVEKILSLLREHNASATFFVLGWLAKRCPEVVRMIDREGHEIGTHGYYHNLITEMNREEFEEDLIRSLDAIGEHTSQKIRGHRASNFTITRDTLWALEILARNGIEYDSSIFPVKRRRYGIPTYPFRFPHTIKLSGESEILEFPPSTLEVGARRIPIAGGGYFRLYPYRMTDRYIEQMNEKELPAMVYVHPWEFDPDQIRLKVPEPKRFQHYVNLDTTEWKLHHLLDRFSFTSIREGKKSKSTRDLLACSTMNLDWMKTGHESRQLLATAISV